MPMTTNLHPKTAKRAEKAGIDVQYDEAEKKFVYYKNDEQIAAHTNPAKGLDEAIQFLASGTAEKQEAATKDKKAKKSIKEKRPAKSRDQEDANEDGDEEEEGGDGEETPAAAGSIVKPKYRKEYGTERHNHDELAVAISEFLRDDKGNLIVANLEALAKENDVEIRPWEDLNNGQRSMNLRNVLRARWRKGENVVVNGSAITPRG